MEIIYIKSSASHDLASFVSQSEVKIVNQYDKYSLKQVSGVIIGMSLDLYELQKRKHEFEEFLQDGGRMFYSGHAAISFLSFLSVYEPINNIKLEDFFISKNSEHIIYKDLDIKYFEKSKGVAGFYSRGCNPPPKGAKIITSIKQGSVPCDWEFSFCKGRFYAHSGNDLYTCSGDEAINKKVFNNILEFLGGKDE